MSPSSQQSSEPPRYLDVEISLPRVSLYVKIHCMKGQRKGDEVDRIVADWRRERPDVDVSPLEVLSRVSRLARHLDRERRQAFAAHDLEQWSFDVLAALRRAGAPYELAPGTLLRRNLVSSGAMTNRLDRLETAGLLRRRPDPDDRRGVLVRLTPVGKRRVDACLSDLVSRERVFLARLSAAEQTALADLLRKMLVGFDGSH
jgi:DNA-binding MarR family transcriptional regulator